MSFEYDHNGLRVQKVVETDWYPKTITYTLHGKLITHMTIYYTDFETEQPRQTNLHFFYDAQSRPAFVEYNGVKYTYVHNLQGDIIELLDEMGVSVVRYEYDAWGKPLNCTGTMALTLGVDNPFRYRGYVYDEETGLYYLRSRYYNPCWGRFVNADSRGGFLGALISHSVFAYCSNVPVMLADPSGQSGALVAKVKAATSNILKNLFCTMVDFVAQHEYARRNGRMISLNVSSKYISRSDESAQNGLVENAVKWIKRIIFIAIGNQVSGWGNAVLTKISSSIPSGLSRLLSTIAGWVVGDFSDEISNFFVDSFSIKQGSYTSICATIQYEHRHLYFFACENEYTDYEVRIYDNTYFELWVSAYGCYQNTLPPQKVAVLDVLD